MKEVRGLDLLDDRKQMVGIRAVLGDAARDVIYESDSF